MEERKLLVAVLLIGFVGFAAADLNAVVQPASPEDIELNSTNDYTVFKIFDGSASEGQIKKYSWDIVDDSQTESGTEANFTFDTDLSESNTIKLQVSNNTGSDTDKVSQVLHDVPQVRIELNTSTSINNDTLVKFSSFTNNSYDGPIGYSWSVEGSNKSASTNFTYPFNDTHASKGGTNHKVEVNVTDTTERFRTASKTVTVTCSNCGGSNNNNNGGGSGGSGGGGGGSSTIGAAKSEVFFNPVSGKTLKMEIDNPEKFGVSNISVQMEEGANKVKISVENQKDLPSKVDRNISNTAYRYLKIDVEEVNNSKLGEGEIKFHVNKSWVNDNNIERSTITLKRYNNRWESLETTQDSENSEKIFYTAKTPGFSYFAISGNSSTKDNISANNVTEEEKNKSKVTCGDNTCQESEDWNTCSQDCSKPDEVVEAEKNLEEARRITDPGDKEYDKLKEAEKAFENGEYRKANRLAKEIIDQSENKDNTLVVIFVLLGIAVLFAAGFFKKEELKEFFQGNESPKVENLKNDLDSIRSLLEEKNLDDSVEKKVKRKLSEAQKMIEENQTDRARDLINEIKGNIGK